MKSPVYFRKEERRSYERRGVAPPFTKNDIECQDTQSGKIHFLRERWSTHILESLTTFIDVRSDGRRALMHVWSEESRSLSRFLCAWIPRIPSDRKVTGPHPYLRHVTTRHQARNCVRRHFNLKQEESMKHTDREESLEGGRWTWDNYFGETFPWDWEKSWFNYPAFSR